MLRQFSRSICVAFAVLLAAVPLSPVMAQQADSKSGCTRDVTRMCRAVMNDGDMAVLACLKQHRARLSKACEKVLADNGQ